MKKFYVQLFWLFISGFSFCQTKILSVIGSSTAAGTGASVRDSSWVNRLTHYYQSVGINVIPHNLAVLGRNCYQGMPTGYVPPAGRDWPQANENVTMALSYSPEVVIVSYPTNNYNVYTINEIMLRLQGIKDAVTAQGKTCYVTTSQPRQDGAFPDLPSRTILKVIRDSIMNRFGNYAIDFFTGIANPDYTINATYAYGDGVHLNNAGHRELFRRVRDKNIFGVGLINRALSSGNWENPAVWENGVVPALADSVVVLGGRSIILNSNAEVRALRLLPSASFTVSSSRTLKIGN